jgi:cyclophilin family peptidyl-prolyl cis-trans isomerase
MQIFLVMRSEDDLSCSCIQNGHRWESNDSWYVAGSFLDLFLFVSLLMLWWVLTFFYFHHNLPKELVKQKFYNDCRIFRMIPNFVAQFGINGDSVTQKYWRDKKPIEDDPVKYTNKRGTLSFATSGPNTRTTQVFINVGENNSYLDKEGFTPFAVIVEGMNVVDKMYSGYGENPNQSKIQNEGNVYLQRDFPKLSYFKRVYLESLT